MYDEDEAIDWRTEGHSVERLSESDLVLRRSIRSLASPEPSPDFDMRVLERMASSGSWAQKLGSLLKTLKPAFAAAAGTVPVAMLLIALMGQNRPISYTSQSGGSTPAISVGTLPVDEALDSPDLSPMLLRRLSREEANVRGRSGRTEFAHRSA
jgi:hypothetical protein